MESTHLSWAENAPPAEAGRRFDARATLVVDGESPEEFAALVDVASSQLAVHIATSDLVATYRFRLVRSGSWRKTLRSWWAAAWGLPLPLSRSDVQASEHHITIQPPWPVDFSIQVESEQSAAIQRLWCS